MGMRANLVKKYVIEYSEYALDYEDTNLLIGLIGETEGWVAEDEMQMEIPFDVVDGLLNGSRDIGRELSVDEKRILGWIASECDREEVNGMAHLVVF